MSSAQTVEQPPSTEARGSGPESDKLARLQRKVRQLELEADKRAEVQEAMAAHKDATLKSFAMRCFATAVAWATSSTIYEVILMFVHDEAHLGTEPNLKKHDKFWVRFSYMVLCIIVIPPVQYILRPATGMTYGYNFTADFFKLVAGCVPMILGWSIMDMLLALMSWAGNGGWDELIVAGVMTGLLAVLECMPCYSAAKAGVDGANDSITKRYLILPGACSLAVGRMWNEFMSWPITELQSKVSGRPNLIFLVQLAYYAIITPIIIWLTATWSEKQASLQKQIGEEDKYHLTNMESHAEEMERSMGAVFISCLSFVYAWSLNSTLTDFFFLLMCGCKSQSSCGYPANCAYAVIITILCAGYASNMQFQDRKEPWGKAHQSLQTLATSLCVGWAWKGYLNVTISAVDQEMGQGKAIAFAFMFFMLWVFAGVWWHAFLKEKRRRKMQRDNDCKKAKVDDPDESSP